MMHFDAQYSITSQSYNANIARYSQNCMKTQVLSS